MKKILIAILLTFGFTNVFAFNVNIIRGHNLIMNKSAIQIAGDYRYKSPDRIGEENFLFNGIPFDQFEDEVAKLNRAMNSQDLIGLQQNNWISLGYWKDNELIKPVNCQNIILHAENTILIEDTECKIY